VFILLSVYLNVTHQSYTSTQQQSSWAAWIWCFKKGSDLYSHYSTEMEIRNNWHHISFRTIQHSCLPIKPTEQTLYHATPFC
jgi:hypothetical protein